MSYDQVMNLVNQYHTQHADYVQDFYNGNLPKALQDTILEMVANRDYLKFPVEFEQLSYSLAELNKIGFWEK